jgi:SAM-dependent methyltransferase
MLALITGLNVAPAFAQDPPEVTEPIVGTPGKDVVYVPQPAEVVENMLDIAKVTAQDFVIDLGSGDGRNVIAAAKRGARALGVEFNPEFVEYSRHAAAAAGVADRATFVQGDMYEADISQATVLALFLLTENLNKLKPKFLALKPGTRIVVNTFKITGWQPDESVRATSRCELWCEMQLYIVPARAEGVWNIVHGGAQGELRLQQNHQMLSGTLSFAGESVLVENGRLRGDIISFSAGGIRYEGRVGDKGMEGTALSRPVGRWIASRTGS